MNNKGFAITSVIYGLSILGMMIVFILMGTISSSRRNVTEQAKAVENFLVHLNQASAIINGNGSFKVPKGESGWYRFEAFGKKISDGTLGAYTTGIIYAEEGDTLFTKVTSDGTEIRYGSSEGEIIMRAQRARSPGVAPGGTTKCYRGGTPSGGNIDANTSDIVKVGSTYETFNGIKAGGAVWIQDCDATDPAPSYIRGFVSSKETGDFNHAFVDGLMLANASNYDDGKVIITLLKERTNNGEYLTATNNKFNGATHLKVAGVDPSLGTYSVYYSCATGYSADEKTITQKVVACTSPCQIDSSCKSLDDVAVVFDNPYVNAINTTIQLKKGGSFKNIYQSGSENGVPTGATGIHISAYQPDSFTDINHGNYYIIPVIADTKVLSAAASKDHISDPLTVQPVNGEFYQKWSIDLISSGSVQNYTNITNKTGKSEYRIMDLARYKALNVAYDENRLGNNVATSETFNSVSRNDPQVWNVVPMKDGTFAIKTIVESFNASAKTGFLYADPTDKYIKIGLTKDSASGDDNSRQPTAAERFYLYSIDFGQ